MTKRKAHPAKRGCKAKWESHVKGRLLTIKMWRQAGVIEKDICKNLGIHVDTLNVYKRQHPELTAALKTGKDDATAKVVDALLQRALGFEYEEVETIIQKDASGKASGRARIRKITKRVVPDVIAQIFYLKNRASGDWHDRREHELSGVGGRPLQAPIIHAYIPDNGRKRNEVVIAENIKKGRNGRNGRNSRF